MKILLFILAMGMPFLSNSQTKFQPKESNYKQVSGAFLSDLFGGRCESSGTFEKTVDRFGFHRVTEIADFLGETETEMMKQRKFEIYFTEGLDEPVYHIFSGMVRGLHLSAVWKYSGFYTVVFVHEQEVSVMVIDATTLNWKAKYCDGASFHQTADYKTDLSNFKIKF